MTTKVVTGNLQCIMAEDLTELKLSVNDSKKDIKYIKSELEKTAESNKEEHKAIKNMIENHLKTIKKDYAGVWVENAMKAVAFIILTALVGAVLKLIIL